MDPLNPLDWIHRSAQNCWNKNVFSFFSNCIELSRDCLKSNGSEFQSWGPEIAKSRKPNVRSRKRGMMRSPLEADRRLCRPAAELTGRHSSIKYSGAAPTRQCRTMNMSCAPGPYLIQVSGDTSPMICAHDDVCPRYRYIVGHRVWNAPIQVCFVSSSGSMDVGWRCWLTTGFQPTTENWSTCRQRNGMNFGVHYWKRHTLSEQLLRII